MGAQRVGRTALLAAHSGPWRCLTPSASGRPCSDIAMIVADPVAVTMLATGLVRVAGELGTLTAPKEVGAAP